MTTKIKMTKKKVKNQSPRVKRMGAMMRLRRDRQYEAIREVQHLTVNLRKI
jgi:hypothetical protein